MHRALETALAELALGPEIDANDPAAIEAWLAESGVTGPDALALRRDFPRLLLYRQLVRSTLEGALRATLPRTLLRLGSRFERDFAEFVRTVPKVSRYLRDLVPSFLEFSAPRWARDASVPEYLLDLAHHEAVQIEVATLLARPKSHVPAELSLDRGVEFIDAVRLVHYSWAVHRLPEDETSRVLPERLATSLLVYRSPEHDVRYLELGPFAARLLSGLLRERLPLGKALPRAASELGVPVDDELLTRAARLLCELAERGALLGKSAPSDPAADLLPNAGFRA